jgi:hypothetical protein
MAGKVRIEGGKLTAKRLNAFDESLAGEIKKLNKAAAETVAAEARVRAPRLTGRLAGSIRAGSTLRAGTVRLGSKAIPYAGPIHWGWAHHNITKHPFLFDALEEQRPAVLAAYHSAVEALVAEKFI